QVEAGLAELDSVALDHRAGDRSAGPADTELGQAVLERGRVIPRHRQALVAGARPQQVDELLPALPCGGEAAPSVEAGGQVEERAGGRVQAVALLELGARDVEVAPLEGGTALPEQRLRGDRVARRRALGAWRTGKHGT